MGSEAATRDFHDYLTVVRRRRWLILLTTLLVTATAAFFSYRRAPVYGANARVLLEPSQSVLDNGSGGSSYVDPSLVATEIQIIQTEPVRALVRKRIGSAPPVVATAVSSTAIIDLRATSTNPRLAANIANAYADAYITYRLNKTIDGLTRSITEIQKRIDGLGKAIDASDARSAPPPAANPEKDALLNQQVGLKQQLNNLTSERDLKQGGAQVIAPAAPSSIPVGATPLRHTLLGLGVGILFGLAFGFGFDYLDDSIKTKEDLERAARGLPVLALIPVVPLWRNRSESRLVSAEEPSSPPAEAYRTLRTSIQFLGLDKPLGVLQVTSPLAGDGKTTTLANLALALCRAGQRVALVSCDLRRPRIHEFFGMSNSVGFTSVLMGQAPLSSALQEVPGERRLWLLASGPLPPTPSELLSSRRTTEIFTALRGQFDVVLVDCPPVLPVTDAVVLASQVDATLVVATAEDTSRHAVARTVELLRQVDAPVIGTVLNGTSPSMSYGYGYGYGYGQYHAEPPGRQGRRKSSKPLEQGSETPVETASPGSSSP